MSSGAAAFRAAVEAGDLDAMAAVLAEDVVFRSPAVFKPYEGKAAAMTVLSAVVEVFEDFRYVGELAGDDGQHALLFKTRAGDKEVEGIDLLRTGEDGLVTELTVMLRPLSGTIAVAQAVGARLQAAAQ
jgi:hypothetical protein